jgi:hypothetical protein
LEVYHIRFGASRDRHGDVVWLDFTAMYRHLVDVTVTSARISSSVPTVGTPLPLYVGLAMRPNMVSVILTSAFWRQLARLHLSRFMTLIPLPWRTGED